jgi:8-oxo-dGTP diphosphatase
MNQIIQVLETKDDFNGVKIAILNDEGGILLHLRDNKPGLFNAGMWDFLGGGRESNESPLECVTREVKEESNIDIVSTDIIFAGFFPAQKDPTQKAVFCVAQIPNNRLDEIEIHEGQGYKFFTEEEFFSDEFVIPAIRERYMNYKVTE